MFRSRDTDQVADMGTRNMTRIVTGIVMAGSPFILAGTAEAATPMSPAPATSVAPSDTWDNIAQCESGGNWGTHTGNGYSGGLQFAPSTWRAYGGSGSASNASKTEQKRVAQKVVASQGWNAWPSCSHKAGVGGSSSKNSSSDDDD